MTSITGDASNIFINSGDLRVNQGNVYTKSLHVSDDAFAFASNVVITQSGSCIAIGNDAGLSGQNAYAVSIGYQAGNESQAEGAVAIGTTAGYENQQESAIAIGWNAGETSQGVKSVAIGSMAGSQSQNEFAIAIGSGAGYENQGRHAIAIGRRAGDTDQHEGTIVLNATGAELNTLTANAFYVAPIRADVTGTSFLAYDSANNEVTQTNFLNGTLEALNFATGSNIVFKTSGIQITQESPSLSGNQVAIGSVPVTDQGVNSVAIGASAGLTGQNAFAVAIGTNAGMNGQGVNSVAIGSGAGVGGQHDNTIILYANASFGGVAPPLNSKQSGSFYVAPIRASPDASTFLSYSSNSEILQSTVMSFDGLSNIITTSNNFVTQNLVTHNIIYASDITIQDNESSTTHRIAIGNQSGITGQNVYSIALGHYAGSVNQGPNTIAIGPYAGSLNQHSNTIVLNANGSTPLQTQASNSTYIYPIRQVPVTACQVLGYDATTKEVLQTSSITVLNSNVGISNPAPAHTLDIGSNVYISDAGSNVLVVTGNVSLTGIITGDASAMTSLTGASVGSYGDNHTVSKITVTPTGRISSVENVSIVETSTFDDVLARNATTTRDFSTTGKVSCYDLVVSNTAYVLNNIYVTNHVYEIEVQQLTVGNAVVSVGLDNVSGLDSGLVIRNSLGTSNVATFFRAQGSTPTYYIGYVNSDLQTSAQLSLATDKSLPVYVYGNVTASNGFIGSAAQLTNLTGVTPNTAWGSANQVPVISVDGTGKISSISNVSISITSDRVSNLVSAVGQMTANTIGGTVAFSQVTGANLQTLTSGSGNVTTNPVQLLGGLVTSSSRSGFSNTNPGHPFVVGSSNLVVGANGNIGINTVPQNAQVTIVNSTGSQTALAVSGSSNQTANLQTWATTNGTVVAAVSNVGGLSVTSVTRTVPVHVSSAATYVVQPTDNWILANTTTGQVTLTLPVASTCPGRELTIRRLQCPNVSNHVISSQNNVYRMEHTTQPAVAQNIILENTKNREPLPLYWTTLVSDGSNWWQMAGM